MLRSCTTLDVDWNKTRYTTYIGIIFFLLMLDYFLTYWGVCYLGFVREVNPFMVWLYEVPLFLGILFRLAMTLFIIRLINKVYGEDRKYGMGLVMYVIFINILILFSHIHWISMYIHIS